MVAERGFAALFVARIRTAKELHISLKFFCSYGLINEFSLRIVWLVKMI